MCGGFGLFAPANFERRFNIQNLEIKLTPRYNARPGMLLPVVTRKSPNKAELMKWGLVPSWSPVPRPKVTPINARADRVAQAPYFRKAFRASRCLVPANGFFEWQKSSGGKLPWYIHLKSRPLFAFAGLYDVWKDAEGKEFKSFTIITCEPNELMAKIHNRMPVILPEAVEDSWLSTTQDTKLLLSLLVPYDESNMAAYPVSTRVNDASYNRPEVIEPLEA
jgi:putative SOS response-associated peptidase YedK